jgi:hypothetical protein
MDHINDGDTNGVLDFFRQSRTLRTVKLRTSGSADGERSISDGETLLVKLAVQAVAENPHGPLALHLDNVRVEEGSFPVDVPSDTLASALKSTTSIEELRIWLGDGSYPGYYFGEDYEEEDYEDEDYENEDDIPIVDEEEKEKTAGRNLIAQAFRDNSSLIRLRILEESNPRPVAALVDALRHNGSLTTVEYRDFTQAQRDRLQLYCARNQGIFDLIAELSESDTDEVHRRRKVDWLPIIPTLFAVVRHSPRMAASRILQGLLGLDEVLGHASTSHTKRTGIQRQSRRA